jgi:hypothetical protein
MRIFAGERGLLCGTVLILARIQSPVRTDVA